MDPSGLYWGTAVAVNLRPPADATAAPLLWCRKAQQKKTESTDDYLGDANCGAGESVDSGQLDMD